MLKVFNNIITWSCWLPLKGFELWITAFNSLHLFPDTKSTVLQIFYRISWFSWWSPKASKKTFGVRWIGALDGLPSPSQTNSVSKNVWCTESEKKHLSTRTTVIIQNNGTQLTSLSISSSRKMGLRTPTCFSPWIIRPGIEPMYVRRWPRMSDWSQMPPSAILKHHHQQHSHNNWCHVQQTSAFAVLRWHSPGGIITSTSQLYCFIRDLQIGNFRSNRISNRIGG